MSTGIFAIVLLAAALHAGWNALVKSGADKASTMTAVVICQGGIAALLLPFVPVPPLASWPYLLVGVALHLGYQWFLVVAYRLGDFTQVYPIARGAAPLIVTLVSVFALGIDLTGMQLASIGLIACGIASISLVRGGDGLFQRKAALIALITGGFIAGYSLVDGLGARLAGGAVSYFGWLTLLNALIYAAAAAWFKPGILATALRGSSVMVIGGVASFTAYVLVIYAFLHAPIALVTALREVSIVFALILGVGVMKEPLDLRKVAATAMTLAGVVLMRLSKG